MIENSFVHLPGIGSETEARLWAAGVTTWDDLEKSLPEMVGSRRATSVAMALEESRAARESGELKYFVERFKSPDMWRLIPGLLNSEFKDDIAYLDIETTGLGFPPDCQSTTVAVLFRGKLELEHQHDRKRLLFREIEREAKMLVTFNGSTFDLPFLRREFRLDFRQPHVDLRYWMARLGRKGGLKAIQTTFEEVPQREYMDIDGFDAVRLWNLHRRGVPNALETLYTYNAEDTLVLEHLMYCGLNMEAEKHSALRLPKYKMPKRKSIPHEVCPHVYSMIR